MPSANIKLLRYPLLSEASHIPQPYEIAAEGNEQSWVIRFQAGWNAPLLPDITAPKHVTAWRLFCFSTAPQYAECRPSRPSVRANAPPLPAHLSVLHNFSAKKALHHHHGPLYEVVQRPVSLSCANKRAHAHAVR